MSLRLAIASTHSISAYPLRRLLKVTIAPAVASSSHDHQYPDKLTASAREQGPNRRVDRAHRIARGQDKPETVASETATSDTAPGDDPVAALLGEGPHVHLQAEQLARLLADRLAEIDRRESQLHLLAADLDNQQRTARLSLIEREQELDRREAFLARLETSAGHVDDPRAHDRLDRFVRADTVAADEPIDLPGEDDDQVSLSVDFIDGDVTDSLVADNPIAGNLEAVVADRQQRLDAIRDTLVDEHRRLIDSRRTLEDWARRQRDEVERRTAELAERGRNVEQQAAEAKRWRVERVTCYEELQRLRRSQRRIAKSA